LDLPLISMMRSLSKLTHKPVSHGEFLAMLRYAPGHEYKPHHDYLEQDSEDYSKIEQSGQRALTVLIYLNHGYEGGETNFPHLNLSYKGATGDCLAFQNCDDAGDGIADSLHAGLPIKLGEKWLATLWVRQKVFWPPETSC
ncbi:MAG: 2OG-Fe(II) oxygenase, partial [Parvularculaceae bacterium]